ncbi:MAG: hypothetical protein NTW52_19740 [Planctomycetota bacterium]|nr:hypothetical protein [Planctomycetota bacterium]
MRNCSVIRSLGKSFNTNTRLRCIGLLLIACQAIGCASMFDSSASKSKSKDKKKESWSLFKKKEYQEPRSLVSTWTEDTLIQPGKPVTRGFGGRFYFYNDRSQVIPVDGELVVYGFEDLQASETPLPNGMPQVSPSPSDLPVVEADKKFRFTAEQFTQHFSQGDLGASYSVWIPWDAAGGPQRKITLIPCFVTKDGRTVRGDASKQVLSGKPAVVASTKTSTNPIQLASSNQSPSLSEAVQQASMNAMLQSSNGQVTNGTNQPIPSNMAPGMQPLGLNTTTIRLGPNTSLSGSMASQNQAFNSPAMSSQNMGYASNVQYANSHGMQMPSANQTQSQSMPNNMLPPMDSNALQSQTPAAGAFHNPLNQTTLPPLGHNLPPTGWMGR